VAVVVKVWLEGFPLGVVMSQRVVVLVSGRVEIRLSRRHCDEVSIGLGKLRHFSHEVQTGLSELVRGFGQVVISFHIPVKAIKEVIIPFHPVIIYDTGGIVSCRVWGVPICRTNINP
jgi:hypothetical protein